MPAIVRSSVVESLNSFRSRAMLLLLLVCLLDAMRCDASSETQSMGSTDRDLNNGGSALCVAVVSKGDRRCLAKQRSCLFVQKLVS